MEGEMPADITMLTARVKGTVRPDLLSCTCLAYSTSSLGWRARPH